MAEKDITTKILLDHTDVSADVMNVLMFHGKKIVSPDDIETTKDKSQYKIDGFIHEQERDVSKIITKNSKKRWMIGFEHQTNAEAFMPIRVVSYDGASYRKQILNDEVKSIYPVITLVLYFGTTHWKYSHHLMDVAEIPEECKEYINDYVIHVFEIAFLSKEQVKMFESDFKYVADYFVQTRKNPKKYKPMIGKIKHIDETLKMMKVLTKDDRFEKAINEARKIEGGASMCEVLDIVENRGINKGRAEGIAIGEKRGKKRGKRQGKKQGIKIGTKKGILQGKVMVYYEDMGMSVDQIAIKLHEPKKDIEKIIKNLKKNA